MSVCVCERDHERDARCVTTRVYARRASVRMCVQAKVGIGEGGVGALPSWVEEWAALHPEVVSWGRAWTSELSGGAVRVSGDW